MERGVVVPRRRPLIAWHRRSTQTSLIPSWWRALLILDMVSRMFGVRRRVVWPILSSKLLWSMTGGGADCFFRASLVTLLERTVARPPGLTGVCGRKDRREKK